MVGPELPKPLLRFLDHVGRLTVEEVRALSAWVDPTDDPMRVVARRGAARLIRDPRHRNDWQEVSEGLRAWAGRSRDFLPWPDRWFPVPEWFDIDAMPFRVEALPHLLDAAAALLVADRLHPEEVDLLLRPWREVMEDGHVASQCGITYAPSAYQRHRCHSPSPSDRAEGRVQHETGEVGPRAGPNTRPVPDYYAPGA